MKTIACLGSGSGQAGEPAYDAMMEVGRLLVNGGHTVATGAYGGAGMEAPAKGAIHAGGKTVGYTWLGKEGNLYLVQTVDCRKQYILASTDFNPLTEAPPSEVQYGIRMGNLMTAYGFIVADGGGTGTFVEFTAYVNFMVKLWAAAPKRLAILTAGDLAGTVWVEMLEKLEIWGMLPPKVRRHILITRLPNQAVEWVTAT